MAEPFFSKVTCEKKPRLFNGRRYHSWKSRDRPGLQTFDQQRNGRKPRGDRQVRTDLWPHGLRAPSGFVSFTSKVNSKLVRQHVRLVHFADIPKRITNQAPITNPVNPDLSNGSNIRIVYAVPGKRFVTR